MNIHEQVAQKSEVQQGTALYNFIAVLAALGFIAGVVGAFAGGTFIGHKVYELVDADFSEPFGWLLGALFVGAPAAIGAGQVMDRFYSGPTL